MAGALDADACQLVAVLDNGREWLLYVTGGRDQATGDMSPNVWMYTPQSAIWVELPACRSACRPCQFFADGSVYVIGGVGEKAIAYCVMSRALGVGDCGRGDAGTGGKYGLDKKDDLLIVAGGCARMGAIPKPYRPLTLKAEMVAFGGTAASLKWWGTWGG